MENERGYDRNSSESQRDSANRRSRGNNHHKSRGRQFYRSQPRPDDANSHDEPRRTSDYRPRGRNFRYNPNRQHPSSSSAASIPSADTLMQERQAVLQETASLLSSLRQTPNPVTENLPSILDHSSSQPVSASQAPRRSYNQQSRGRNERNPNNYPRQHEPTSARPYKRHYGTGRTQNRRNYDQNSPEPASEAQAIAPEAENNLAEGVQELNLAADRPRQETKPVKERKSTPSSGSTNKVDLATQRERLTEQLSNGRYECMVCCDRVRPDQAVWGCGNCYHVFHLGCIKRWAKASQNEEGGWRCPACQFVNGRLPGGYYCFCGKAKDPEWNRRDIPHSCGELCQKSLVNSLEGVCSHQCNLLCHPGPCPSCSTQVTRSCPCGKTSRRVRCGAVDVFVCGQECGKALSCGKHSCQLLCHTGECGDCEIVVKQSCFCGQSTRELLCDKYAEAKDKFMCEKKCNKLLTCGNHHCEKQCHADGCDDCPLLVANVTHCPCGKVRLQELYGKAFKERKSCKDPIPTCRQICDKLLGCGPEENPHRCIKKCHMGACGPCDRTTPVRCRCSKNEKDVPCSQLDQSEQVLCERRCNKKRSCGRHKCLAPCCVDREHICPQECGRKLTCGLHTCEALCHAGNCPKCWRTSFDELRCHCGTSVMYPPIACGTRPPECDQPCVRPSVCGHPKSHNCHADPKCPPCTVLCSKWCYGHHELRKNVPCYLEEVACGKPCGKPLPCVRHQCISLCHPGPCVKTLDNGQLEKCTQPCTNTRPECGHPCGAPCHAGECPNLACKQKVNVQCVCGHRKATVSCEEQQTAYRRMATSLLASKMAAMQSGQSVDLKNLLSNGNRKDNSKSLECNEECALMERNRRLALALQIRNPDLSTKPGPPKYPDSLKDWAKKDPRFVNMVHDKLTDLVQLAKQSVGKQRSRSYSFDPMNRDKRQFVHDYAEFFGCETESYDEEPKRNVVATAFGETSWLPSVPLPDIVLRESGQRKMPAPALNSKKLTEITETMKPKEVPRPSAWGSGGAHFATLSDVVKGKVTAKPAEPVTDYFDYTG